MSNKITYKDAGVDVDLADRTISSLSSKIKSTFRPEVIGSIGGFAAQFRPNWRAYTDPVLVSATDGVGTKLKLAFMSGIHNTVGIDLVAMNVNDLVVVGAEPLFFLDYFATGKLQPETFEAVVTGIADGCKQAGCSLIGGETAEMPDFYGQGEYDLAGFCVGMVDRSKALDGSTIQTGDVVIGMASSGLHSNGFSLVRKLLFDKNNYSIDAVPDGFKNPLGQELLTPTRIYVRPVLSMLEQIEVKGLAHITGGGFPGNIPRIMPPNKGVRIKSGSWEIPYVFKFLQELGSLDDWDMFETFNMGIGMVGVVSAEIASKALEILDRNGVPSWIIGDVFEKDDDNTSVKLID
ncbi:MAG: phosphoribosylformylglycinamidine cyclo-ligase [Syntrophaceae bacterium]|nr:phosphoribosylformylglycinamidine cyclo-ligase [Syntrophaceae bacterium]